MTNAIQLYVVLWSLMSNLIYTIGIPKSNDIKGPKPPYTWPNIDSNEFMQLIGECQLKHHLQGSHH